MERQRYTTPHSPDRANRHRKLAALVPIGSEAKAASQGTQSATTIVRRAVLEAASQGTQSATHLLAERALESAS